jgi:hypothetical protein
MSEYAYPDQMTQVLWAKEAWKEACNYYEIEIGFNGEIIQMVCVQVLLFDLSNFFLDQDYSVLQMTLEVHKNFFVSLVFVK